MKKTTSKRPEWPKVIETFNLCDDWSLENFSRAQTPFCWNGLIGYRKMRVTIEMIDEPVDVLKARVQKMYDDSRNIHDLGPLHKAARELGMELKRKY